MIRGGKAMEAAQSAIAGTSKRRVFPLHGWLGACMVIIAWPLNWMLPGTRTNWLFFPLWLGFALSVDGLVFLRKGSSLLTRSWKQYFSLFLVSAPAWWLFELINLRTTNWHYLGVEGITPFSYFLLASLNFSTVIPAVFGMGELISTFSFIHQMRPGLIIRDDRKTVAIFFATGWVMLALLLAWPKYFFPFVWISIYFITEPVNIWLGHRHLVEGTRFGDWRVIFSLWVGVLITGFFWEMWNFWAYPKWVYQVPGVDFFHLFEMPLLGYGGYLPFALELHALYQIVWGLLRKQAQNFLDFAPVSSEGLLEQKEA
jgi:hypothetical protein